MLDRILGIESYKLLAPSYLSRVRNILENYTRQGRILDIGCGRGEISKILNGNNVYSIDIAKSDLQVAKQRNPDGNFVHADALHLPFRERMFQKIVCIEVLQYIKKDQTALQEISRVLAEKGTVFLTVPNKNFPFMYDPIGFFFPKFSERRKIGLWGYGRTLRLYESTTLEEQVRKNHLMIDKKKEIAKTIICLFDNAYTTPLVQKIIGESLQSEYLQDDTTQRKTRKIEKFSFWTRLVFNLVLRFSWLICSCDEHLGHGRGTYIFIKATRT